jgi:hypothetical protein
MRLLCIALVGLASCSHSSASETSAPAEWHGKPFSRISGNDVTEEPSGESFRIPQEWLDWNRKFHNNLHLSRAQLEGVRDATGEWDREYAAVVNAILPFDSCAAHVGGEGWGRDGVSFGDLQVRVYTGAFRPQAIRSAVLTSGRETAERFFQPVRVDSEAIGGWTTTKLEWRAWYGDYGAVAHVDVLVSQLTSPVTVLVFMYSSGANRAHERDSILTSFAMPAQR